MTSTAQKRRPLQPHIPVLQLEVGNKAPHLHGYSAAAVSGICLRKLTLTWRCGPASGELAVARRVSVSCAPAARPWDPFRSWWGLESSAAEARLPAALGAGRLQPGREQWSRSWCPGGGAGGRARVRRRGSPDRAPPALQYAAAASSQASGSPSSIAPPRATAGIDCSTAVVRPWDLRKVLGLRCFSSCGARSRPGKARSPQCAKHSLRPVRTLRPRSLRSPDPRHAAAAPAFRLAFGATGCREPRKGSRRSAISGMSLSPSLPSLPSFVPLTLLHWQIAW